MIKNNLRKKILKIPSKPGIYVFKGLKNKSLYIGKALNLKNRVKHYLKTDDTRLQKMISGSKNIDYIETRSDIEALILESQLIKKHRPLFNIMLRDDKQYSFVVFTGEDYPKILTTHQPKNHKETIGPFTDAEALKTTLRLLRQIFPYCTCKQSHHNYCLNYHIGKCPGFCCLKNKYLKDKSKIEKKKIEITITKNSYNLPVRAGYKNLVCNPLHNIRKYEKNIGTIKDILTGKRESLIKKLKREMRQLAKNGELEKAIELRNKIVSLDRIFENARIIKNSDILKINNSELESLLKVKKPIIKIGGYDVSNIQGAHATGSMVVFTNGEPDKNQYRKFKISCQGVALTLANINKTISLRPYLNRPNDTTMLKKILERRFRHEEWPLPDLILIDGGKAQLNAANGVISNYYTAFLDKQRAPSLIALTKNKKHIGEKIYISGIKSPISLTKLSATDKNLLLTINSEAHRFAISYYRKLHRQILKNRFKRSYLMSQLTTPWLALIRATSSSYRLHPSLRLVNLLATELGI